MDLSLNADSEHEALHQPKTDIYVCVCVCVCVLACVCVHVSCTRVKTIVEKFIKEKAAPPPLTLKAESTPVHGGCLGIFQKFDYGYLLLYEELLTCPNVPDKFRDIHAFHIL